jgi:hypothetical protein
VTDWFRKLKRWQKGGLIGCIIGFIFAVFLIISLINALDSTFTYKVGMGITRLHMLLNEMSEAITPFRPFKWVKYGLAGIISEWLVG